MQENAGYRYSAGFGQAVSKRLTSFSLMARQLVLRNRLQCDKDKQ
jgi:hypothetical protein